MQLLDTAAGQLAQTVLFKSDSKQGCLYLLTDKKLETKINKLAHLTVKKIWNWAFLMPKHLIFYFTP